MAAVPVTAGGPFLACAGSGLTRLLLWALRKLREIEKLIACGSIRRGELLSVAGWSWSMVEHVGRCIRGMATNRPSWLRFPAVNQIVRVISETDAGAPAAGRRGQQCFYSETEL